MVERKGPLKGVNLGGWLVLEKWMTPSVFAGVSAEDEYGLCQTTASAIQRRIRRHRDTFITLNDFVWMREHGIQAVRLPVGYWVFGGEGPFLPTVEYVDRAFQWAEQTGLKILLDLHAAPGSQNGWDHSGQGGACNWHTDERNIIKTLEVLLGLTRRYGRHKSLLGIELLNEPKWTVPRRPLLKYYEAGYRIVRAECPEHIWVVFHDSFRPRRWKRKLRGADYTNLFIDTHHYQTFGRKDKELDMAGHLKKLEREVPGALAKMAKRHPVIVGEWSLALDPLSLRGLDESQKEQAIRSFGAAQLKAFQQTSAWFFWSYKTEGDGMWNYRDAIARGWLPDYGTPEA